ncbi:hypothetical protein [Mucilaginibacter sp. UYCu711]|uniref:hypothetical protein n=1 Tax=Mucilaginibacter sp. UYCu711 TaxID=3156339 RepID=UPI003D1D5D9F
MATFKIVDVFTLQARKLIVITGTILSGNIAIGMSLVTGDLSLRIKSIEAINSVNNADLVGLTFDTSKSIEINNMELLKDMLVQILISDQILSF